MTDRTFTLFVVVCQFVSSWKTVQVKEWKAIGGQCTSPSFPCAIVVAYYGYCLLCAAPPAANRFCAVMHIHPRCNVTHNCTIESISSFLHTPFYTLFCGQIRNLLEYDPIGVNVSSGNSRFQSKSYLALRRFLFKETNISVLAHKVYAVHQTVS